MTSIPNLPGYRRNETLSQTEAKPPKLTPNGLLKSQPESTETTRVRELLKLLVKAQKTQRFYQANNVMSDRLRNELFSKLSAHLADVGAIHLSVREFQVLQGEDVVYESHDRNDSFAFVLFRDGIRRLSFHRGLEEEELHDFLKCLNRVALLSNEQDDLVTLFWEADFKSIKYYAIEELTAEDEGPSLQEQLTSGSLDGQGDRSVGARTPADAVSLDVAQPIAHLPVEACRMAEHEVEALHSELAKEEDDPFGSALVELAVELTLLETSEEERKALAEHMVSIVKRLLGDGELEEVARILEHLNSPTVTAVADSEPVKNLKARLLHLLAQKEQLQLFLEHAESDRCLEPAQITTYLVRLGPDALPLLLEWMGRMSSAAYRRAVTEAVRVQGGLSLAELEEHLPPRRELSSSSFLREVLFLLTQIAEVQAVPFVERLLGSSNPPTRREATRLLGRFRGDRVEEICLRLLADDDIEVRSTALDTLVRRGKRELARPVLDHCLGSRNFDDRGLSEKRRIFAAVAKLGSEDVLDLLTQQLRAREQRWFASRKEREAGEAIVHGIRMIASDGARRRLRELADDGNRYVRAACLQESSGKKRA